VARGKARDDRTLEDLHRAVRSLTRHFKTDTVFVIGSQAILVAWPDAPVTMRTSLEIDAYPANFKEWEAQHPGAEASEETNALFGYGSAFHDQFGFFVDGVDERTARLPPGWRERCQTREWEDEGIKIRAMAPSLNDLIVSKLLRLTEKDRDFIAACHRACPLDISRLKELLGETADDPWIRSAAAAFLDDLTKIKG